MAETQVIERKLDNGIPVLLIPAKGTNFFTHVCVVHGGSRYEIAKRSGISHMLEHMMFKGTRKRKTADDIATELEFLGGQNNAYTGYEEIGLYVNALAENFADMADIMGDQIINSVVDTEELEKEKHAVFEEINMRLSDPQTTAHDAISALIYGEHQSAGRDIAGTHETVASFTAYQLRTLIKKHFIRSNMVIAISGKIPKEDEALNILNEYYAEVPEGTRPRKFKVRELGGLEPRLDVRYMDIPQSVLVLALQGLNLANENMASLQVLNTILGKGMSSRLFQEVREKRGLAYYVGSGLETQSDTGTFYVYGGLNPSKMEEALKVIRGELASLASELVEESELQKAKNILRTNVLRGFEKIEGKATRYAERYLLLGNYFTETEVLNRINNVTAEQVQSTAKQIFSGRLHLSVVGPHKGSLDKVL